MKCKREHCQKSAADGQVYCSRECAPLGLFGLGKEKHIRSVATVAFTTAKHGAPLLKSSAQKRSETSVSASVTPLTQSSAGAPNKRISVEGEIAQLMRKDSEFDGKVSHQKKEENKTEGETKMQSAQRIEPGTEETKSESGSRSMTIVTSEIPPGSSTKQLLNSNEEQLASVSLVDDVLNRLHKQVKRLVPDQFEHEMIGTQQEHLRVKSVVETTKQIASLVRLKLEAAKTFHDINKHNNEGK